MADGLDQIWQPAWLAAIQERYHMLRANGICHPIPAGLPHAQLIQDLGDVIARVDELQRAYDSLTGERFSDRVHMALKSRAEVAEARYAQLREQIAALIKQARDCHDYYLEGCVDADELDKLITESR